MKLLDRRVRRKSRIEGAVPVSDDEPASPQPQPPIDNEALDRAAVGPRRRRGFVGADLRSRYPIYLGLLLIALGFAVTAYTWSRVAALFQIPLQLPYLASGVPTAIALFILGASLIWSGSSRREASRRQERLDQLTEVLRSIAETLQDETTRDDR